MPLPQLILAVTSPAGAPPIVSRTFQLGGSLTIVPQTGYTLTNRTLSVQFGTGPFVAGTLTGNSWQCTGAIPAAFPWDAAVTITVNARASFRFFHNPSEPDIVDVHATATYVVRLTSAIAPTVSITAFTDPVVATQLPMPFTFTGSTSSPQGAITLVQYKVENGDFANAVNVSGNWSQWRVVLPLPPATPANRHTLTVRAVDQFGTVGETSKSFAVQPQPPVVIPPGSQTTLTGAPTTSSVTSWTRLEPQSNAADIGTSSSARLFDPLWMLTRQWQMGEFQGEDAGTPVHARVRATSARLARSYVGEVPQSSGGGPATVAGAAYDPARTPLDVLAERRTMRPANESDPRMLTFAVEAGLHFLRMLELQSLTKSYRAVFVARLALQPIGSPIDDATTRYVACMVGRAPDGRQLAAILRTSGAGALVLEPALNIATADRPKVQQAATNWLAWYDAMCSEPAAAEDAWNPARLEYALSVGTRFSTGAQDDMTYSASEVDGPLDWSSFDVNPQASLTSAADVNVTPLVEATIPAPVTIAGLPAPRFWEMEDARLAYGLVPVGPTDLAELMMIEYSSTYGNDWFVVPLTLAVGSVTRVDSLVVTDTFGVRNLVRPIGDPALPPAYFSLWQSATRQAVNGTGPKIVTNRFFLPSTLTRSLDGAPLEDVLFMRDEMANVAWAIERTIESPIEQPAPRDEAADTAVSPAPTAASTDLPRYRLSSDVPPNWIPLLPVQVPNPAFPNTPGQILSRLKRGAMLQPDGTPRVNTAKGEVLRSLGSGLLYDEEVPREGARITRRRRLARWSDGSTWLWSSYRNHVGQGEGASHLEFDQVLEPNAGGTS